MGDMELGNRRCLYKESRVSDGCDIDRCAFDGIGRDAEPGTQYGGVSRRIVMLMLPHVGGELRVHNPAERHEPERKPSDCALLNLTVHKPLSKSRCLYRLLFLNPRDGVIDFLFGQQSALEIFLHAPLLVDEDAHG